MDLYNPYGFAIAIGGMLGAYVLIVGTRFVLSGRANA